MSTLQETQQRLGGAAELSPLATSMAAGASPRPIVSRYRVSSNDVIADELKVNVTDESNGRVMWCKDRGLGENEILSGVYVCMVTRSISAGRDETTFEQEMSQKASMLRWVIHRPTRGWYIRLRAPSFPPESYIALTTCKPSQEHADGALEFACRSNIWPPAQHSE